jgi:signal-transduction protein with cAMP-binding, CBS, and nucleotidyltransferase domain
MSKVEDIVRDRQLFYVEEGKTVADVARRMTDLHVGAIIVLCEGKLRGVFSERDLMKRVVAEGRDPMATLVEDVMTRDVVTVEECASLEDAMELMQANSCRHLPVTRGSQVTAFLSMRDLMNEELARKTEELHHMRAYIHGGV